MQGQKCSSLTLQSPSFDIDLTATLFLQNVKLLKDSPSLLSSTGRRVNMPHITVNTFRSMETYKCIYELNEKSVLLLGEGNWRKLGKLVYICPRNFTI